MNQIQARALLRAVAVECERAYRRGVQHGVVLVETVTDAGGTLADAEAQASNMRHRPVTTRNPGIDMHPRGNLTILGRLGVEARQEIRDIFKTMGVTL